jgi:hypothetical protein
LAHLHLFSRLSPPEFRNPNFFIPLRTFLSSGRIQVENVENPISDVGALSYFCSRAQSALVWSVPSSDMTHLHSVSRFSSPEFQNTNFYVLLRTLLSSGPIQGKELGNPISDEGSMSFFW